MVTAALALLKTDLGYTDDSITPEQEQYLIYLIHKLEAARARIRKSGIDLNETDYAHLDLLVSYAAYLYRRRDSNDPMPKSLRWALNNAITESVSAQEASE